MRDVGTALDPLKEPRAHLILRWFCQGDVLQDLGVGREDED